VAVHDQIERLVPEGEPSPRTAEELIDVVDRPLVLDHRNPDRSESRRSERHVGRPTLGGDSPTRMVPERAEELAAARAHVEHRLAAVGLLRDEVLE